MFAAIDIGSNTVRMLTGNCRNGSIAAHRYVREMTRLAGDFSERTGLAPKSMQRTLTALLRFRDILSSEDISCVRTTGTEALRRAPNREQFKEQVLAVTGFKIDIIDGEEEATLTTRGVLSVIHPFPDAAIVVDIGGGSTELVCLVQGQIKMQQSYPLGVVRLYEEYISEQLRQQAINACLDRFCIKMDQRGLSGNNYQLIGTAGTVTTLAAMHQKLTTYDSRLINNYELSVNWIIELQQELKLLSIPQRELLPGMEKGRGDLILPGLQILQSLSHRFRQTHIKVSDSGLLEGILLSLGCS